MKRDLRTLLGCMMCLIPIDDDSGMREQLGSIQESSDWQPPESTLCWERAAEVLYEHFGEIRPTEDWQGNVSNIFLNSWKEAA